MDGDRSKGSVGSSSSSKTTTSGTSGTSKTTATTDPSHISDSTADVDFEITESDNDQHIGKRGGKFDSIMVIAIIFQIAVWGGILILAYIAFRPLYLSAVSPIIASIPNPKNDLAQGVFIPLTLGLLSSILATIIVLITRGFFYRIRDRFPAGALFRGIARVSDPCLIFTLRMKDKAQCGDFITPIPNYSAVHNHRNLQTQNQFEPRQNTPWVTSTPEAQSLALILNVLGRVGRSENIQVTFADMEYDRWDAPMFSLGGNWKTMRAFETCEPYFKFQNDAFILLPTAQKFTPSSRFEDMGLLQKMINPTTGLPVWVAMGYRGGGTVSASYALVRWWKYLGTLYGTRPFGLLVAFDERDGWQQSHIVSIHPKPKWHTKLRHPYAWHMLKKTMTDS